MFAEEKNFEGSNLDAFLLTTANTYGPGVSLYLLHEDAGHP